MPIYPKISIHKSDLLSQLKSVDQEKSENISDLDKSLEIFNLSSLWDEKYKSFREFLLLKSDYGQM